MKNTAKLLLILVITVLWGCSSNYNYFRSDFSYEDSGSLPKEEALKSLVLVMLKHKSSFMSLSSNEFFDKNTKNLRELINIKYKFHSIKEDHEKYVLTYSDENCNDAEQCLKGFMVIIYKASIPKICKVKKVHKKTRVEENYYELKSFVFSIGSFDPDRKQFVGNYLIYYLKLDNKKDMDELAGIYNDIFNTKISCN